MQPVKLNQLMIAVVLSLFIAALFFVRPASFFFLPLFFVIPTFRFPKRKGEIGDVDEEDPADWWKKGKKQDA